MDGNSQVKTGTERHSQGTRLIYMALEYQNSSVRRLKKTSRACVEGTMGREP